MMICFHCDEPIFGVYRKIPHFDADHRAELKPWHIECLARSILGGLNHLQGRCICCGGTEPPDPPEMTRRQAALAAVEFYRLTSK